MSAPLRAQPGGAPGSDGSGPRAGLPALVAEAARRNCPNQEDAEAVRLWEALRTRYRPWPDTLQQMSLARAFRGRVPEERVGALDLLPAGSVGTWSSPHLTRYWRRVIATQGYARREASGWISAWSYPPLEAEMAAHFVDPLFTARNTLSLRRHADQRLSLVFCPRARFRRQPSIEGELILARDTTLSEVEWRFRTPEPLQHAGARVLFAPRQPGGGALVPRVTVTFARDGDGYLEEVREIVSWIVSPHPAPMVTELGRLGRESSGQAAARGGPP